MEAARLVALVRLAQILDHKELATSGLSLSEVASSLSGVSSVCRGSLVSQGLDGVNWCFEVSRSGGGNEVNCGNA